MADAAPALDAEHAGEPVENEAAEQEAKHARAATRKKWLVRLALGVVILGLLWLAYYLLIGRNYVSTDNAYVNAEVAQVTPLISASVIAVHVKETQPVKRGDILVELDPTNARIAYAQAQADLAEARRHFRQASATSNALSAQVTSSGAGIATAQAQLASAQADFERARIDLSRRQALAPAGAVSGEELTTARQAYNTASAALQRARAEIAQAQAGRSAAAGQLAANQALVQGSTVETDPGVLSAKARLENARLDIERSVLRAPIDGVVAKLNVQVGQRVAQGTPVMTIVPLSQVYIDANFKEKQLRKVRVGMPATVTTDLYGSGVVFHGRVAGFSGGTGSAFSLIPAQNATGNWIKVVQRVPVRIELDPKELAAHPLRVGLSSDVEIDLTGK